MNISERANNWHNAINKWMTKHPWQTIFCIILYFIYGFSIIRYSFVLAYAPIIFALMVNAALMLLAIPYLHKNYKPKFCDKCGHVLPDEENYG